MLEAVFLLGFILVLVTARLRKQQNLCYLTISLRASNGAQWTLFPIGYYVAIQADNVKSFPCTNTVEKMRLDTLEYLQWVIIFDPSAVWALDTWGGYFQND